MSVTLNKRRVHMNRTPVCFDVYRLQELDFEDEPELQSACRTMTDKVHGLSSQFAALLERVTASRIATLTRQRNAAVEHFKSVEEKLDTHIRNKAHVTAAYDDAGKHLSLAQQRQRNLKNNPPNRSRLTDDELARHEQTIAAADKELEAAGNEIARAQLGVSAWLAGESSLKQELVLAQDEVTRISRERSRLNGTAADAEPDLATGLGKAVEAGM